MFKKMQTGAIAALAYLIVALPASAADSFTADDVVAQINTAKPIIVAVGLAMLAAVALIVGYRLIRKITG
jgi:hypothetical protein